MRVALTNFTGGEVAASLSSRFDLSRYKNSVQCMENFLPNLHGNVERRSGTVFLADLGSDAVLYPFSFNVEKWHNFVLVLTHKKMRIANHDGLLEEKEVATPWNAEDLLDLSICQIGDVIYFAHKNYPLHKLLRTEPYPYYTWALSEVVFNSSLSAPSGVNCSFKGDHESEYTLRYQVVAVDYNGRQSLASGGSCTGKHPSDWVSGDYVQLYWNGMYGSQYFNVYREEAGYYGLIGIVQNGNSSFQDHNYAADISDTPSINWNPFADGNYPGVVSFHEQRMVLAATKNNPQAFYMSRTGDFENFRKSRPLKDDDAIEYHIASGTIDSITWVASFGDLLVGTSGSEYKVSGDGAPITTSNVSITAQSYWGSTNLFPMIIGNSVMHVQRHGARVRDLFYSLEKDGYSGNDLSIMAPHLFEGHSLRQWTYQQTPSSSIWIVRDDGVLLALTYMKEHDIWGWSRHLTNGKVRSIVMVSGENGDDVFMVVQRNINGAECFYFERLATRWQENHGVENAFFVDAGLTKVFDEKSTEVSGLEHLEGCTVSILADGSPIEGLVVHSGSITLPYGAKLVQVGLAYSSVLAPLPVEGELQNGSTLGLARAYGQCSARVQATVGGKYGALRDELFDFPYVPTVWGDAVAPFSGDLDFTPGGGQKSDTTVWIVQDRPLPFTLSGLVVNIDMVVN